MPRRTNRPVFAGLLALAILLLVAPPAPAQEDPEASPTPKPRAKHKITKTGGAEGFAYLRFWNLTPKGTPSINVKLPGHDPAEWLMDLRWFDLTDYGTFPPGTFPVTITDATSGRPIAKANIHGDASTWTTFVLQPDASGKPKLTVLDDTYDFDPAGLGRVSVWNAVLGARAAFAIKGQSTSAQAVPVGEHREVDNLPLTSATLDLSVLGPGAKKPIIYPFPLDFQHGKHVTIVIIMDRYGEITAGTYYDGLYYDASIPLPEPDTAATPAAGPATPRTP